VPQRLSGQIKTRMVSELFHIFPDTPDKRRDLWHRGRQAYRRPTKTGIEALERQSIVDFQDGPAPTRINRLS
jgi:hypothetical protein